MPPRGRASSLSTIPSTPRTSGRGEPFSFSTWPSTGTSPRSPTRRGTRRLPPSSPTACGWVPRTSAWREDTARSPRWPPSAPTSASFPTPGSPSPWKKCAETTSCSRSSARTASACPTCPRRRRGTTSWFPFPRRTCGSSPGRRRPIAAACGPISSIRSTSGTRPAWTLTSRGTTRRKSTSRSSSTTMCGRWRRFCMRCPSSASSPGRGAPCIPSRNRCSRCSVPPPERR
mmetsp:Transcript_6980/g.17828  ORF Transcript_6980/g.17828 Transcript_6980/m.17828 type:complete len:230 (+) Transcript_6980:2205-2894(+)